MAAEKNTKISHKKPFIIVKLPFDLIYWWLVTLITNVLEFIINLGKYPEKKGFFTIFKAVG